LRTRRIKTSGSAFLARFGIHEGTAASRQHQRRPRRQDTADDAALAVAEFGFAALGENFGDGHAGGRLDLGIGVDERQPEPRRQTLADRALARAHHADEHDGALAKRGAHFRPVAAF
jgi:hypothetical protein